MADIDLKTETPDTSLPTTGFLFGADSQAAASPSVFTVQSVATTLLGSTTLTGAAGLTADAPVLNLSQTWNNGAVTFTGLKFNATDTASNASSLLMDLQTGGTSRFNVRKNGVITTNGGTLDYGATLANYWSFLNNIQTTGSAAISGDIFLQGRFFFGSSNDTILTRRAAANLRFGAADAAAPVAQTLSVQSGTAGASATTVSISGTALTIAGTITGTIAIGHAVTGTGVSAGTLITAGSGTSWTVNNSQTVGPITAYFNSVGQNLTITGSQGSGPSAGGSIIFQVAPAGAAATTAQNALATALTIDSTRLATFAGSAAFPAGSNSAPSIWFAGASTTGFFASFAGAISATVSGTNSFQIAATGIQVNSSMFIGFNSNSSISSATDTTLFRDAANTLAQRNANNGQIFRLYGRFTDITNDFERFFINAPTTSGDAVQLGTQKGATTGAARALELQTDATSRLTLDTVGSARIVTALTVATLPGTPLAGMIARVTDATLPVIGATVAGGGAAYALVNYNGANWTVIGV